jgi:hypothetical protein
MLRNKAFISGLLLLTLVIASCTPAAPEVVTATPDLDAIVATEQAVGSMAEETVAAVLTEQSPDLEPTFDTVRTEAVATFIVELTEQAPTATATQLVTATSAVSLPTATFAPLWTATSAVPTITNTPTSYSCRIESLTPALDTVLDTGSDFDMRVVLENTGTLDWEPSANFDFRYVSGTRFQSSVDAVDLTSEIERGEEVTFTIDAQAPSDIGNFTSTWSLVGDIGTVCSVTFRITTD